MNRPRITMRGDHEHYDEATLWAFLRMHAQANAANQPATPPPTGGNVMAHGWAHRTRPQKEVGASLESGKPAEVRAKMWTTHHTHKATDPAKTWPGH